MLNRNLGFGDLKEIYGKKEETSQSFITPNVSNKVKPEQNKAHEQAQHMQENLSHGKGVRYGASSPSSQSTPNASKHHESSRGF